MINILPQKEQEVFRDEEKKKIMATLEILSLVFLLCLVLILTSMNVYVSGQVGAEKIIMEQARREFELSDIKEFSDKISLANKTFSDLDSFYRNQIKLTKVLEEITGILPGEIYLNNFSYQGGSSQVTISGFSRTREALLEFRESLEEKDNFEEIYFPSSCWIKSTDISFSSKFKIKK